MTTIKIGKKGLLLFLLWLRGPLRLVLSIMTTMGFVGFAIIPTMVLLIGWSTSLTYSMILFFIISFGSFLLLFYYERLIRYLQ